MSDQMSDQLREGDTEVITWSAFLAELGMPPALSELSERQMRYGICSEPACWWPIAGWCVACRAKLCLDHLAEHRNLHARERLRADESERDDRDELAAHLVDDGTISAAAAAKERCRLRGICSDPNCDQPIDGWIGAGPKLCAAHLSERSGGDGG